LAHRISEKISQKLITSVFPDGYSSRMKIRFGLIFLVFLVIGLGYEAYINHFSGYAYVNYLLTGFLYSALAFIVFYIVVKIILAVIGIVRHKEN
jgi:hypothetical protein